MVLISSQPQGSLATGCLRPISWTKQVKLKSFVALRIVEGLDGPSWQCNSCVSCRSQDILRPKLKNLQISAFKSTSQNDESVVRSCISKFSKSSMKISSVPDKGEGTSLNSPETHESPLSCGSSLKESRASSPSIQKLFHKWLMMLRTWSYQTSDGILGDAPPQSEIPESQNMSPKQERSKILKVVCRYFLGLNATITIPILIFVPSYLAVNVLYGAEVSKELKPLWVLGPVIIALYVQLIQCLCALYVFSFKHTVRLVRNLPTYYRLTYAYMSRGKLRQLLTRLCQPVLDVKNLGYKKTSKRIHKELEEWVAEKYLDFLERIWPFYCRLIRFLKRANLIN